MGMEAVLYSLSLVKIRCSGMGKGRWALRSGRLDIGKGGDEFSIGVRVRARGTQGLEGEVKEGEEVVAGPGLEARPCAPAV